MNNVTLKLIDERWAWLSSWFSKINKNETICVLVGGAIRDWFLEQKVNEIDFLVLKNKIEGNIPTSLLQFAPFLKGPYVLKGTKDIRLHFINPEVGNTIDILPLRAPSLREDLMLRDFTVNTLIGLLTSDGTIEITDVLGTGFKDLNNKVLRTPLHPLDTLKDDPVRMLRALRFSVLMGFKLHHGLMKEIILTSRNKLLLNVSIERVRQEFEKILCNKALNVGQLARVFYLWGLEENFLPQSRHIPTISTDYSRSLSAKFHLLPLDSLERIAAFFLIIIELNEGLRLLEWGEKINILGNMLFYFGFSKKKTRALIRLIKQLPLTLKSSLIGFDSLNTSIPKRYEHGMEAWKSFYQVI